MSNINSTLKYFSCRWLLWGTLFGMLGTELLGKGLVLVTVQGYLLPGSYQGLYNFLTMGGSVFTVMTGLGILAGILMPCVISWAKKDNDTTYTILGFILMVISCVVSIIIFIFFFGDFFGAVLGSIIGYGTAYALGLFFGYLFGAIFGVAFVDISIKIFLGIFKTFLCTCDFLRIAWRQET